MSAVIQETVSAPTVARVEVKAADFINAAKAVTLAAGTDDSLPVLASVNLTLLDRGLIMAATDRYRLAEARHGLGDLVGTVLVNAKELTAFVKSLKIPARAYEAPLIGIEINGLSVTMSALGVSRTFQALDSQFPPYAHLVPSEFGETGPARIALNPKYVMDGAKGCELMGDYHGFTVDLIATAKPVVMRPMSVREGWAYFYLLMPQRFPTS